MNTLPGVIKEITSHQDLTNVTVEVRDTLFEVLTINSGMARQVYKIGDSIQLLFKETEVILGKGSQINSLPNRIDTVVETIQHGQLLSKITMSSKIGLIKAIIPTASMQLLTLQTGDQIVAMVKTNEMMISL